MSGSLGIYSEVSSGGTLGSDSEISMDSPRKSDFVSGPENNAAEEPEITEEQDLEKSPPFAVRPMGTNQFKHTSSLWKPYEK